MIERKGSLENSIMSQQPQWKRDGLQKKSKKTPKNARRKRQQVNYWRKKLKSSEKRQTL